MLIEGRLRHFRCRIERMHLTIENVVGHVFEPFGRSPNHILSLFLLGRARELYGSACTAHRDL